MQKTSILLRGQTELEEMDRQLAYRIKEVNAVLQKEISENKEEYCSMQRATDKQMNSLRAKQVETSDHVAKHKDLLEEQKKSILGLGEQCTRTLQRVDKVRDSTMEEIARTRDEVF